MKHTICEVCGKPGRRSGKLPGGLRACRPCFKRWEATGFDRARLPYRKTPGCGIISKAEGGTP